MTDKINGLLQSLNVAVGAVYIVPCNLSTIDGLINGAVITETAKMQIYQVHFGFSLGMSILDNCTVKNTNTIMVAELVIHGHQYLHSTEKQLYVIVELLELNFH